ncbi:hypothetical protein HD806DRAFT_520419 [Xylariaceae sp. AK1471]|nr:hypothetical protein HD806DRAFT_520419 [Xylariaceae sp. AK1471]
MNIVHIYSIVFGGLIALYPLYRIIHFVVHLVVPRLVVCFARYVRYPLFMRRSDNRMSITRLELLVFIIYLASNTVLLTLWNRGVEDVQRRTALLAIINTTLLFLGGRTNPLADFLRVPLSTYYLSHHWVGRVAILEGLIHSAFMLTRARHDQTTYISLSGYIVSSCLLWIIEVVVNKLTRAKAAGGLLTLLLTSSFFLRRFFRTYFHSHFSTQHALFSLLSLATIFWHVILQPSTVPRACVFVASALWGLTTLYRFLRIIYLSGGLIERVEYFGQTTRIRLSSKRHIHTPAGSYFYVFPPGVLLGYNIAQSRPLMVMWRHSPESPAISSTLSFLVSSQDRHSPFHDLKEGQRLLLDGPYGQDLGLRHYETVIMAAKGVGIRQQHDSTVKKQRSRIYKNLFRDATRKVAIFWSLEHNSQEEWVASELQALKNLDKKNSFFVVWCIYPSVSDKPKLFDSKFWKCFCLEEKEKARNEQFYLDSLISQDIEAPGRSIVVTCGDPDFTAQVRGTVLSRTRPDRPVNFVELEFRPRKNTSGYNGRTNTTLAGTV